jgi:hypothetical protein
MAPNPPGAYKSIGLKSPLGDLGANFEGDLGAKQKSKNEEENNFQ